MRRLSIPYAGIIYLHFEPHLNGWRTNRLTRRATLAFDRPYAEKLRSWRAILRRPVDLIPYSRTMNEFPNTRIRDVAGYV